MLKKTSTLIIAFICSWSLLSCDTQTAATSSADNDKKTKPSKLQKIKQSGILHVATRIDPTTYTPLPKGGYTGLEYDLVMLFAKHLGVKVDFQIPESFEEILQKTASGEIDIAAAGLTITAERKKTLRFAPSYHEITEQIIYRTGTAKPKSATDLTAGILEVTKGTSHVGSLQLLKQKSAPKLNWLTNDNLDSKQLIELLNNGLIDYTVADSNQAMLMRRFYPKLHIAFDISKPRELAWAMSANADDSLHKEVSEFFKRIKKDKSLKQLLERHYGHAEKLNYVDKCKFYQHQKNRLPEYKEYFMEAGEKYDMDWRLLAAIGYQESHWEEGAISPTGVRGLMMLTKDTAKQVGIKDRTDPVQSIKGGALYFHQRIKTIPKRIPNPDRIWFALASYNIGYGHLEDARVLTQKNGGNPDKWIDVKEFLPKLSEEAWHTKTKHGYARGKEPVIYVENVRNYYDLLLWQTNKEQQAQPEISDNNPNFIDKLFNTYFMIDFNKRLARKKSVNKAEVSDSSTPPVQSTE
ncbi:MAG: membrane-bound lytic murein transglycosylase MltF [Methylococcaceae bacterium]|nr:membrane-bound lytic murein transglycosylase MltF [Methylococcaceae bacterium]